MLKFLVICLIYIFLNALGLFLIILVLRFLYLSSLGCFATFQKVKYCLAMEMKYVAILLHFYDSLQFYSGYVQNC